MADLEIVLDNKATLKEKITAALRDAEVTGCILPLLAAYAGKPVTTTQIASCLKQGLDELAARYPNSTIMEINRPLYADDVIKALTSDEAVLDEIKRKFA